ncbi:MAG: hypothetical protein M3Y54_13935 [Bacteroidota bacterium]|nr:hypothetical protein [Bacteroidota bacterium]
MNPPKEVGLFRKFVSTARSVTTGHVGLPLGILRLHKNLYWLKGYDINPLSNEELETVNTYYELIREFPLGQERSYWGPEVLRKSEEKLDRITAKYQEEIMSILCRIVAEAA